MKTPLQITFKNLKRSGALVNLIKERTTWLERVHHRIISCRVIITGSHQRHHPGALLYEVRIDLRVPGKELVINHNPSEAKQHHDIHVTIHDAFDAARRNLKDSLRKQRKEVKHLEKPPHAKVVRLLYEDGKYGFIQTEDGRELYFHSNSVLNGQFDRLQIGTQVRFSEEKGENGPQASTVEIVGKQHRMRATD